MANDQEQDLFPWIFGTLCSLVAMLALVAVQQYYSVRSTTTQRIPEMHASPAPLGPPKSSASTTTPAISSYTVWECEHGGQKVYSDQRCGDASSLREIREPNRMPAETVRNYQQNGDNATTRQANGVDEDPSISSPFDPNQDSPQCASLRAAVTVIEERMRKPYRSSEGDYYRGRLRDMSARQYDLNCVR